MTNRASIVFLKVVYSIGIIWLLIFFFPSSILLPISPLFFFLGIGLVLYSITQCFRIWYNSNKTKSGIRISGTLTSLYSIYPFLTSIILFAFNTFVIISNIYSGDISIYVVADFVFFIWILISNKYRRLRSIYVNDDIICAVDYGKEMQFAIADVNSITPYMRYLYKMEIEGYSKSVIFIPKFRESFYPGSTPKSVKELKMKVQYFKRKNPPN